MSVNHYFYPQILFAEDLNILQSTVRALTEADTGGRRGCNPEQVAKIVLRLYRSGMTEPRKLMDLAALMAEHKTSSRHPT